MLHHDINDLAKSCAHKIARTAGVKLEVSEIIFVPTEDIVETLTHRLGFIYIRNNSFKLKIANILINSTKSIFYKVVTY